MYVWTCLLYVVLCHSPTFSQGVFETNPEHEFYHLTSVMKNGLHAALQPSIDIPAPHDLAAEHFKAQETQVHEDFEMQTFAGPVFAHLRSSLGLTEEEYQHSLSNGNYLQFVSNSKSKADFFVTNNKRFFLKTQSKREVQFLLSNLQAYMDHLEKYPHSLIVKFLGVHRIVIPNEIKKYFIVMQSVFYPDDRINIRYDIKGCEVGRWTDPAKGNHTIKVLKDNNFEGEHITLGHQKSWFVNQVKIDTTFLRGLNVLDYSLLLANQPLHRDELEGRHSLANNTVHTTNPTEAHAPCTIPLSLLDENSGQRPPDTTDCGSDQHQHAQGETTGDATPLQEINCQATGTSTEIELQEFHNKHRRLLPNFENAIHVLDGPQHRYFVGIIDIFTVYGQRKRLENLWKRSRFPGRAFSTVSPRAYSQRFCQWVQNHTQ